MNAALDPSARREDAKDAAAPVASGARATVDGSGADPVATGGQHSTAEMAVERDRVPAVPAAAHQPTLELGDAAALALCDLAPGEPQWRFAPLPTLRPRRTLSIASFALARLLRRKRIFVPEGAKPLPDGFAK